MLSHWLSGGYQCSQACASGKGGSTLDKQKSLWVLLLVLSLTPLPRLQWASMTSILLKTCSFTVIFRPLPYMNHQDFQELLTYLKILEEKKNRIWPHLLKAFSRKCMFIKRSGENVRAITKHVVVSGIQKEFDFSSF